MTWVALGSVTFVMGTLMWSVGSTRPAQAEETSRREAVVATRPVPHESAPEYRLAYKFQANQDVHLVLTVESEIRVQKRQFVNTLTNQTTTERHFHVAKVNPDGSATLDLFIDRVQLSHGFNGGAPTIYDTNSDLEPPRQFQNVKECVGKISGQMKVTSRGELQQLLRPYQSPSDDSSENFLDILPDHPVHVGDVWKDDIKVPVTVSKDLHQKLTLRRYYRLESVDGNVATIHLSTSELSPVADPMIRAQLIQKLPEGKILFDMAKGVVTSRELRCVRTEAGVMGEGSMVAGNTSWKGSLK